MKSEQNEVPMVVIKRLPRYYRYLGELMKQGVNRISSAALSEKMGVKPLKSGRILTVLAASDNRVTAIMFQTYMLKLEKF